MIYQEPNTFYLVFNMSKATIVLDLKPIRKHFLLCIETNTNPVPTSFHNICSICIAYYMIKITRS